MLLNGGSTQRLDETRSGQQGVAYPHVPGTHEEVQGSIRSGYDCQGYSGRHSVPAAIGAPFTPTALKGRTGRGDTCFSTYLSKRLTSSPEEATRLAGAVTTLKQEHAGPWQGTLADAEALMARQWAE